MWSFGWKLEVDKKKETVDYKTKQMEKNWLSETFI